MTETRLPSKLIFGHGLDEIDKLAVDIVHLPYHFGERKTFLFFSHSSVKGVNAAVHR